MALVTDKLKELAGTLADLKDRVRIALAGELARAVADAVRDVVQTVLQRESVPKRDPTRPTYSYPSSNGWDEPRDPWAEERDGWEEHPATVTSPREEPRYREPGWATRILGPAGAVALRVARWWSDRTGKLTGAVGLGLLVVTAGAYGGPAVQAVLAVVAAATDLLLVPDLLAAGAAHLGRL